MGTFRHIVWGTEVFVRLLINVLSASLAVGPSEYGAVNGATIITFISDEGLQFPIETNIENYARQDTRPRNRHCGKPTHVPNMAEER